MALRQKLQDSINDYQRHRRAASQQLSAGTLRNDEVILRRFIEVNGNIVTWNLNESHVDRHFDLAKQSRSEASLKNDHAVLKSFFKWCRQSRPQRMATNNDPMWNHKAPKQREVEKRRLPVQQFPDLLDAAESNNPRDRGLVAIGLFLLCRASEIRTLRIGDLRLSERRIFVNVWKSKKADDMYVNVQLDAEMRKYLTWYQNAVSRPLQKEWFLVPGLHGHRPLLDPGTGRFVRGRTGVLRPDLALATPWQPVKRALEAIGFPTRDPDTGKSLFEGEHTIRRSGARAWYDALTDKGDVKAIDRVQAALHHINRGQTEHYIGLKPARIDRDEAMADGPMYDFSRPNVVDLSQRRRAAAQG